MRPTPTDGSAPDMVVGVVLYRNARSELERLVTSLELNRGSGLTGEFSVWFLDNSPDQSLAEVISTLAPAASYQHSGANLGFGAGHNRLMRDAFSASACKYYVCVNPDAILHPDCLSELVREARRQASPGLVEALQFPDEHPKTYDPATHEAPWASGCVLLVTRTAHETIGGFDEKFFMYCEDVDLSWRARLAKLSVSTAPRALAHHHVGDRPPNPNTRRELLKSGIYLARKYGGSDTSKKWFKEYVELGGNPFAIPVAESPTRAMKAVANFAHMFTMAEARW